METLSPALLTMKGIDKSFHGTHALNAVDFDLRSGEVHVLLGENGAGKSTLVKILAGIYQPDLGEVLLRGESVHIGSPAEAQKHGIQMIHQELNLVEDLSVAENLFIGWKLLSRGGLIRWRELRKKAGELLDSIEADIDPRAVVGTLSIAHRQMVEIARSLVHEPDILILDEPTATLTPTEAGRLFALMERLRSHGVGLVFISHRLEEIFRIGDRVTVLRDGEWIGTKEIGNTSSAELVQMMVGRQVDQVFPKRESAPGETVLKVESLSMGRNSEPVSFELRKGEILGIGGLVGSGRSRLMRAILGLDGVQGHFDSVRSALRNKVTYAPEDRKRDGLILNFEIAKNVSLSSLSEAFSGGIHRRVNETRMAEDAIEKLNIACPGPNGIVDELSGGNQQKVILGRLLAARPDVLLLDEPTRGIDVGAKFEIYRIMSALADKGAGIIFVSSELPELLGMSDRILVMHRGQLAGALSREEANDERVMQYATGA